MASDQLEVWLDANFVKEPQRVGTLFHDRGQIRFAYAPEWLKHELAFPLDPGLTLDKGAFFPNPEAGNFGIFLDSCPDRWGQTLMKRRETLAAKDEGRAPRNLRAWDFLIGVQDETRQGALRFKDPASNEFIASHALAAPPIADLRVLEAVAAELTNKRLDDLDALRKWLAVLVAPGASLGGARPKANFRDVDGSLWIAKFPARDDDRDIGGWEGAIHAMAVAAKVDVPEAKVLKLNSAYRTFCVRRFDRDDGNRVFYASAMTLLKRNTSEGASYLEIAEFIQKNGVPATLGHDLAQLFRRIAFGIAVGNRDDHLRNHGFVLTEKGWRLSQAFDINPNVDKGEHVLNIDDVDNRPSLETLLQTAPFYGLNEARARDLIREVLLVTSTWREVAARSGISAGDIEVTAPSFECTERGLEEAPKAAPKPARPKI